MCVFWFIYNDMCWKRTMFKIKSQKGIYKTGAEQTRTCKKKLRYKMPWRSENPLLVGNTRCVLFVGIINNGKKSVDNRVINYCHNQTLLISVLCCLICYGFILLKPSVLIDFSFFPYGVRIIKFWHWSA